MSEAFTDRMADCPPLPRTPAKCEKCNGDMILSHVCTDHVVVSRAALVDAIQWRDWDSVRKWLT